MAQSIHGEEYEVTQDIIVRVLKPTDLALLQEPLCPEPEVHILLPSLAQIKSVTDKLGKLAPVCTVRANRGGEFRIGAESAHGTVETEWRNLKHPEMSTSLTVFGALHQPLKYAEKNRRRRLNKLLRLFNLTSSTLSPSAPKHSRPF